MRCEVQYLETGDTRAAILAARAHKELGEESPLLRFENRLRGTPEEGELLELTATYFLDRENTQAAIERFRRLITVAHAASDHVRVSRAHYELFYLFWERSTYREALAHAAEAYEASRRAQNPELEARALQALFTVLYETGDLDSALESLRRAAELTPHEDRYAHATISLNESAVRLDQGRYSLARRAIQRALELRSGIEGNMFFRSAHLNLVNAHLAIGNVAAAEENLERASHFVDPGRSYVSLLYYRARVEAARKELWKADYSLHEALALQPEPEWKWRVETQLGRVEEDLGRLGSAEQAYQQAARTIETMRESLALDDLKSWLLEQKREPYEALFRLQAEGGRAVEALDTLERGKARAFLDAFVQATLEPHGANSILPFATLTRFEAIESLLPTMESSPVVSVRSIEAVLRNLSGAHVLVYFLTKDGVWLVRISRSQVQTLLLPTTVEELHRIVSDLTSRPDDRSLAVLLGQLLLPEGTLPLPGARLHLVTDGFLGKVAFPALLVRDRYLAEDYFVSFVPSLNALAILSDQTNFGTEPPVVLAAAETDLPGAAAEARTVASRLAVTPRIGTAANLPELLHAARARLLHLAVHTGIDHRGPWLQLGNETVTSDVILRERIGPPIVILATCASAARAGKDLWGSLGAAFLAAGSRSVVASLRSVKDDDAREFIERFYAEGGARDPARALALAQRAFILEARPPSFWGAFVHLGIAESTSERKVR